MTERFEHARRVRARAELVHGERAVAAALDEMAERIARDWAHREPVLLCVMVGGVFLTTELTRRLDFPFELDFLHATRYRGRTTGGELLWRVSPQIPLRGRHVLVLDDILDEGHTLAGILEALRAQQPTTLATAILCRKDHDRADPALVPDYLGLTVPDRYVFGCGMDYHNLYRQLPAIYAVREE